MVKQTTVTDRARAPIVDYSVARERAIKWLGDQAVRDLAFKSLRNLTAGDAGMLLPNNFKPLAGLAGSIRELGVYATIALIVPGGSLIALCVWACRHRRPGQRSASG